MENIAPSENTVADAHMLPVSNDAQSDAHQRWAAVATRLEGVCGELSRLSVDIADPTGDLMFLCLLKAVNDLQSALARYAPPDFMPPTSQEANDSGASVEERESIARNTILSCCADILDIMKAKYLVDFPISSLAAANLFSGPGNVKIFRIRRGTAGDIEMAQATLFLEIARSPFAIRPLNVQYLAILPLMVITKRDRISMNAFGPPDIFKILINVHPISVMGSDPSSYDTQQVQSPDSAMFVYKFGSADYLWTCRSHPSTRDTRFICVHEPLGAAALDAEKVVSVSFDLIFVGLMTAMGYSETELITVCEHAATFIARKKVLERRQVLDGVESFDVNEKFTVLVTRDRYNRVIGSAICVLSTVVVEYLSPERKIKEEADGRRLPAQRIAGLFASQMLGAEDHGSQWYPKVYKQ